MWEIDPENAVDYLHERGVLPPEQSASVEALSWGVSNVVLRVEPDGGPPLVLKQSREQLRTQAAWFSRLDRIWREVDVLRTLSSCLPPKTVPAVLFEDRPNYLFAMEAVDRDHVVWKAALLRGEAAPSIAAALGEMLGTVHRETANRPDLQVRFGNRAVFEELRVDPFYRRIADVHPDLRHAIEQLIDETLAQSISLVLGDFSPKNTLITRDGISLVDFETGVYGDPAFDLGFFTSHLLLKAVLHARRAADFVQLVTSFNQRYRAALGPLRGTGPWTDSEIDRRTIAHLAGCMLARVDGKSPVDYLTEPVAQELVREFCRWMLLARPLRLQTVLERLTIQLSALAGPK